MGLDTWEKRLADTRAWIMNHANRYRSSGGVEGHIIDFAALGGLGLTPTLLLRTIGRKSGKSQLLPLIYGVYAGHWVIVGSKGGAPEHPAWYLNLKDQEEVDFQVATQAFRSTWREPVGAERQDVWTYMARLFPPYDEYQKETGGRLIPLVMMKPREEILPLTAVA